MPYPFTPYHLGPSCLLGLLFRRWVDAPVFVLSCFTIDLIVFVVGLWQPRNVAQDHFHTLLTGVVVEFFGGIASYFFKGLFRRIMRILHLPYRTNVRKMLLSGITGTWVHIFIDSLYRTDTALFWPNKLLHLPFHFKRSEISFILILCSLAACFLYIYILKKQKSEGIH